ncbi:MAG: phosphodiester glycosidase family protein [Myxococcales bacterium]
MEAENLGATPEAWMKQIVGGDPSCLVNGVALSSTDSHYDELHPRSAVGLSQDKKTLILLVVDGRRSGSVGVTTYKLGQILLSLGAWDAMNFDGGGSSALWLATEGVVNTPSDGSQRVVANHLGVMRRAVPANEPSRCCSPEAVAGATGFFDDVAGTFWGFESIEALHSTGVTNGCSANPPYFCPDCRSTRAAAATFLVRAMGWNCVKPSTATFADVPTTHSMFKEIECAYSHGLTQGCGNGNFCPDDPASRGTVAIFAARAMGLPTSAPASSPFSDVAVSDSAAGAIVSLVDHCIVSGCSPGMFCPDRTATRAELAVITARAANLTPTSCGGVDAGTPGRDAGTPGRDASTPPGLDASTPIAGPDASQPRLDASGPQPGTDAAQAGRDADAPIPGVDTGSLAGRDAYVPVLGEDAANQDGEDASLVGADARTTKKDSGEGSGVVGGCGCGTPGSSLLGLALLTLGALARRRQR